MGKYDSLGTRMKESYEFRSRYHLPRRSWTIIRVDMRAGHTYARGMDKPYDMFFANGMCEVALALVKECSGSVLAYTQSDECSILLYDFASIHTEPFFGGNVQKLASIAASIATRAWAVHALNTSRLSPGLPSFDARCFCIPDPVEVANYFIWRQNDATRNSILGAAHALLGHRACQNKTTDELQELMFQEAGTNWNDYPDWFKRGTIVRKFETTKVIPSGAHISALDWGAFPATKFTQSNELKSLIPLQPIWGNDDSDHPSNSSTSTTAKISPYSSLANPRF